ncbi:MAG TPA: alkaline phosphatase D family protein [Verrucomicrobiales bacterium]|nr:alkaline phosphatase D family protein [Verrucomicrobiales bacterium]
MFIPEASRAEVVYSREESSLTEEGAKSATFEPLDDTFVGGGGRAVTATLSGLAASSAYHYGVRVDGESNPAWDGAFRTAPESGQPVRFRVALTSCMRFDQPQSSWFLLLAQRPDFHLTVGDTHYADTTDPAIQWEHHRRYRALPSFATVIRNVPTYAMWDDHDYGPNDSDGAAEGKENSLAGWKQFWTNPGAGTDTIPGAFFRFSWGDVDFFVVDGRYHRSPDSASDDETKRMLGDAQFGWLLEGLKASRARFKVIASGSTFHTSEKDGWRIYTFARHRLLDSIREHQVSGVLYFSGDIHRSLVREHHESDRCGYPFVEVISSGVANSTTLSFATIDFDTLAGDPTVRVRIVHGDGTVRDDRSWRLSQLTPH